VVYFTSSYTALVLSERGHLVLKGKLHCRLASLLGGRYTADDIVEKVAGEITPAQVYYALDLYLTRSLHRRYRRGWGLRVQVTEWPVVVREPPILGIQSALGQT
jgi:hypothetical protein